jgi:molybdopterin converting factor small subunit
VIRVKLLGHIRTSLSCEELEIPGDEISATEVIEELRQRASDQGGRGNGPRLGFTKFNTIMIVNDGEAFTPAANDRVLRDGDSVLLLPFSHGG